MMLDQPSQLSSQNSSKHLRLRVESCVKIILDLNRQLGEGKIRPEIIEQFEQLQDSLEYVNDETVDEKDIDRIEEATNHLLAEVRVAYAETPVEALYKIPTH